MLPNKSIQFSFIFNFQIILFFHNQLYNIKNVKPTFQYDMINLKYNTDNRPHYNKVRLVMKEACMGPCVGAE